MSDSNRVEQLLRNLSTEIQAAKAGSDQGQFPILDLVANLRDETAKRPELQAQHTLCVPAWDRLV
jgi:hypothetical protein